jgi:GxxExxY protein
VRKEEYNENSLSREIIAAGLEVHKALGPGLLESAYEECLAYELSLRGLSFERQKALPVIYKGVQIDAGYRLDLVVGDLVVVELKSVDELLPIHEAQVLTYLKMSKKRLALLLNFNVPLLKNGIKRIVLKLPEDSLRA